MIEAKKQLADLIKAVRKVREITKDELCDQLGFNIKTYNNYENGTNNIPDEYLSQISDYLDYDFVKEKEKLGIPPIATHQTESQKNIGEKPATATNQLAERVKSAREAKGVSRQEAADYLGISKSGYDGYENAGNNIPDVYLEKLTTLFECEDLLAYKKELGIPKTPARPRKKKQNDPKDKTQSTDDYDDYAELKQHIERCRNRYLRRRLNVSLSYLLSGLASINDEKKLELVFQKLNNVVNASSDCEETEL